MALCTAQHLTQKGLPDCIDRIIEILLPGHRLHAHPGMFVGSHPQVTDGQLVAGIRLVQFISGNLLCHELVERHISIEGTNNVIPIPPGDRTRIVTGKATGVSITGDIQPVLGPLFSIARTRQ